MFAQTEAALPPAEVPTPAPTPPSTKTTAGAPPPKPANATTWSPGLLEAVLFVVLIGLGASALVRIIRALLPATALKVKPWGCDLCMAFWCSAALTFIWWQQLGAVTSSALVLFFVTVLLGATAVATWVLEHAWSVGGLLEGRDVPPGPRDVKE